jgi:hypothetical protein
MLFPDSGTKILNIMLDEIYKQFPKPSLFSQRALIKLYNFAVKEYFFVSWSLLLVDHYKDVTNQNNAEAIVEEQKQSFVAGTSELTRGS